MKKLAFLIFLLPAFFLAACFSSGPDNTLEGFLAAQEAGDGEKICSYLSPTAQEAAARLVLPGKKEAKTCQAAAARLKIEQSRQTAEIEDIKTEGDRAVATIRRGESVSRLSLVKIDGEWKIELAPPAP